VVGVEPEVGALVVPVGEQAPVVVRRGGAAEDEVLEVVARAAGADAPPADEHAARPVAVRALAPDADGEGAGRDAADGPPVGCARLAVGSRMADEVAAVAAARRTLTVDAVAGAGGRLRVPVDAAPGRGLCQAVDAVGRARGRRGPAE